MFTCYVFSAENAGPCGRCPGHTFQSQLPGSPCEGAWMRPQQPRSGVRERRGGWREPFPAIVHVITKGPSVSQAAPSSKSVNRPSYRPPLPPSRYLELVSNSPADATSSWQTSEERIFQKPLRGLLSGNQLLAAGLCLSPAFYFKASRCCLRRQRNDGRGQRTPVVHERCENLLQMRQEH